MQCTMTPMTNAIITKWGLHCIPWRRKLNLGRSSQYGVRYYFVFTSNIGNGNTEMR